MEPTLALINGKIYTMDDAKPRAEAVAVYGSRIVAVGETMDVKSMVGPSTRIIDLQGKTVIPGFIDSHIHFTSYALRSREVDLDGAVSIKEVLVKIKKRAGTLKLGDWIVGRGWDTNLWRHKPTKEKLDMVSQGNPVALWSKDGHTLWVNSQALSKASITPEISSPNGGVIERDLSGEATGILKERAVHLVESVIPRPPVEEVEQALKHAVEEAHAFGITSIHVPEGRHAFQAFQRLLYRDGLKIRVFMIFPVECLDSLVELGLSTGYGNDRLRIGAVKLFADGSLGSRTAAMFEAYIGDPYNRGIMTASKREMRKLMKKSSANGLGIAVHAIGDRANRAVLDLIEELSLKKNSYKIRHRIEHAQHISPTDIERFGKLGVIASVQPAHISLDMDIADKFLGRRSRWSYPLRTLLDAGAKLSLGSDCPVMSMNPILGIYTAVTRKRVNGYPPRGWYPEECITVEEAVRAYTKDAAYASGEELIKGSIECGKLADITVLSSDIFKASEEEILEVRVEMTIFDGEIVYSTAALQHPQRL